MSLKRAAAVLEAGGVVLYPTRTLWGIGADARRDGAVTRVAAVKGIASPHPFLVLVADRDTVFTLASGVPAVAQRLMDAFWPGDLTLLLPASSSVPSGLIGPHGQVGIRLAQHPVPRALIAQTGAWLISTSANPTGQPSALSLETVAPTIRDAVDAVVQGPPSPAGVASTIVAVDAAGDVRVIREGALPAALIHSTLTRNFGITQ